MLAGGQSSRFGSDKAFAIIDGLPLVEHAVAALAPHVTEICICGALWQDYQSLADQPVSGLGPLGGINAALQFAAANTFAAVITVPVDCYPLPASVFPRLLERQPAYVGENYVFGCWPVTLAPLLSAHLASGARSVRSWLAACGASEVPAEQAIRNINFPGDLLDPY